MKDMTSTSVKEAIAEEVRAVMARRKTTQKQLAADLGWTVRALAPRLNGDIEFSITELVAVCMALGSDPADIVSAAVSWMAPASAA